MVKSTKNICRVLFFSGVLLVTSACSDSFLQTDSPNQPSQTTYWQTESDALMALTACYDAMQSQNLYDDNIDGWKFGFLGRETSTDNGDHTWGDWEVLSRNVLLPLPMNAFLCTGMLIMK